MVFASPLFLLLIPLALAIVWLSRIYVKPCAIQFCSDQLLQGLPQSLKQKIRKNFSFIRLISVILIILACARPQTPIANSQIETEGIDIVLALDCSSTMLGQDFVINGQRQSRIDVVKSVVSEFIKNRQNDRIGVIAFAQRPYVVCPLTLDHGWVLENIDRVKVGLIEDGTAIGLGLTASLNRLRNTKAKSKIVILLTDGLNNAGKISPLTAGQAAKALKIKVYTIGVGSKDLVPYPVEDLWGNLAYRNVKIDMDEETLKNIADITQGKYFNASSTEKLRAIYQEIDKMEKTVIEDKGYREMNELYKIFLLFALILLIAEIILNNTWLRKIP